MIQLIIAFLLSLGFNFAPEQKDAVTIDKQEGENYGIVITDDVGTRTHMNLIYDKSTNSFKVVE